jgi:hypothetical protein
MSSYKKEIQDYLPADELHVNDAVIIDQPDVPNTVTEEPGVTRKATAELIAEFVAQSLVNAAVIDGKVEAAVGRPDDPEAGTVYHALSAETTARQNADAALQAQIDLGQGRGGALTAHDFGSPSAELTQEDIIGYACEDIWGAGGTFTYDDDEPSASAYVIDGVTHTAAEMFNNTWARNTHDNENHKWVLTNTPDTDPAVYIWTDVGQDVVGDATPDYAGVARLYPDYTSANTNGSVTQAAISGMYTLLADALNLKLNISGGALTGILTAMNTPTTAAQVRSISVGTSALTPGTSALATGEVYLCYE